MTAAARIANARLQLQLEADDARADAIAAIRSVNACALSLQLMLDSNDTPTSSVNAYGVQEMARAVRSCQRYSDAVRALRMLGPVRND